MTTEAAIVKCRRKDYDEKPFFFLEPKGETPYAVCWLGLDPDRVRATAEALLAEWPEKLEAHFEAPVHPEPHDNVFDLFGYVRKANVLGAFEEHPDVAFRDGGVRLRIWRKDNEDCIGLDEHGLIFYWSDPKHARAEFQALGIEERKAPLILDEEHWHSDPNDADAARSAFLKVLAIS